MSSTGPSGQQGGNSSNSRRKAKKDLEVSGAEKAYTRTKTDKANVGKYELDNYEVKDIPFSPGISGFTRELRQKQFERNRKFFQEKVLTSKNRGGYTNTLDSYSSYMKNRLSNKTDAYGNKLNLNTGPEVEKDPYTPESREAAGRANARAGYAPAVEIYGADGNRYVEGGVNAGLTAPTSAEVSQSEATKAEDPILLRKRRAKARGRSPTIMSGVTGATGGLTLGKPSLLGS
jgi:hypothetical protein